MSFMLYGKHKGKNYLEENPISKLLILIEMAAGQKNYQAVAIKISNLLICFCSFDLSCPILKEGIFIENAYIVLSCPIK